MAIWFFGSKRKGWSSKIVGNCIVYSGLQGVQSFCSVMIEYLQLKDGKHRSVLQYIVVYDNVQYISVFLRHIVLYCGGKYCGMLIYCNLASSVVFN